MTAEKAEQFLAAHLHDNAWRRSYFRFVVQPSPKQERQKPEKASNQISWAQEKEKIAVCFLATRVPVIPTGNIVQEAFDLKRKFLIWQADCTQGRINPRLRMIIGTMTPEDLYETAFKKFNEAKRQKQEVTNDSQKTKIQADKEIFYWNRVLKVLAAA